MLLAIALLVAAPVFASDVPIRPLTYNMDPKLSDAPVANLLELYVDPDAFVRDLKPARPPQLPAVPVAPTGEAPAAGPEGTPAPLPATAPMVPPTGNLLLLNERGSWAVVSVNGTKVGKIGPYIVGVVGPVPSGGYDVSFTWANGLTLTYAVDTNNQPTPGAFGGKPPTLEEPGGEHTTPVPRK